MKSEQAIKERIADIDQAIRDIAGKGEIEELSRLVSKAEVLEWVLGKKSGGNNG